MLTRLRGVTSGILVGFLLAGCASTLIPPEQAYETVRPKVPPVRNITSFSESLRCMDDLFATYGLGEHGSGSAYVTSAGIVDKTGKNIGGDNRDVLISSISKMSAKSGTFKFINYDPRNLEELGIHIGTLVGRVQDFTWPSYEIIGAITQLDENVTAGSTGFSLALDAADLGFSSDQLVTVLSVDFNVSEAVSRQILNGITATNSIAITRSGKAGDMGGRIKKAGLFFNLSLERSEGLYAALRALIELSTIEILGQLAKVPYWQCLQIEQTNPEIMTQINDWFASMTAKERIEFVQRALLRRGDYRGPVTGTLDNATRDAISHYQQVMDLVPSGRVDLALYRQLIGKDLRERVVQARESTAVSTAEAAPVNVATLVAAKPFITLTTPRGTAPTYNAGEQLSLSIQVSQDVYLYCYYRDGRGQIMKLYPNRFQGSARVSAKRTVTIPEGASFSILLDTPNTTEKVLCLASPTNLDAQIPFSLKRDLESLSVTTLEDVASRFRQLDPDSLAQAWLNVQVGKAY